MSDAEVKERITDAIRKMSDTELQNFVSRILKESPVMPEKTEKGFQYSLFFFTLHPNDEPDLEQTNDEDDDPLPLPD
jgi:hypothetical protein